MRVLPAQVNQLVDSVVVMEFPAAPAVFAVTVTVLVLDVAVTVDTLRLMAAAIFAAMLAVVSLVAKFVPVLLAFDPPVKLAPAQVKLFVNSASEMLLPAVPAVNAVTVTVVVPDAVTPIAGKLLPHATMAAARFVPCVDALEPITKVPVVELLHPFDVPAASVPPEGEAAKFVALSLKEMDPPVILATVITPPELDADTLALAWFGVRLA